MSGLTEAEIRAIARRDALAANLPPLTEEQITTAARVLGSVAAEESTR